MAVLYVVYDDEENIRLVSRDWNAVYAMLENLAGRRGAPVLEVYGDREVCNTYPATWPAGSGTGLCDKRIEP